MKKYFSFFLFCFSLLVFAQEYSTIKNVPYYPENIRAKDAYIASQCQLDLYLPKNIKNFPTIIWFHGGGLTGGQKEIPKQLTEKGFAVIGVGYRLYPKIKTPAPIEDAAAAVSWIINNIEKYGGNKKLIFLSGHSAGGYLDMMITLDKQYLAKYNLDSNILAAVIPFSGQCVTHFTIRKEMNLSELQPTIDHYAPLYHVRKDVPPIYLITGDREMELYGRYEENAYMQRMLKLTGNTTSKLFELQGFDHGAMAEPAFPLLIRLAKERMKELKTAQ